LAPRRTRSIDHATPVQRVLIIDDEEIARYVLTQCLASTPYVVGEAATGMEGLRRAREDRPQVIFPDLNMPGVDGYAVLEQLTADPATRDIPVVTCTSKKLTLSERARLAAQAAGFLAKDVLSRETVTAALAVALGSQSPPSGKKISAGTPTQSGDDAMATESTRGSQGF